jgi:eukaryotic-like serine/threonine-protein kinase
MDRSGFTVPQTPRTLARRYRLLEVIGRGGMGTVYRATDGTLDRTVAVKVLAPALAESDPVWVARFEREARAAAALTHPGVATVYDTGVQDATRFIVMEYVSGESLDTIIGQQAPLEPGRAVRIAAQVAGVLSAAHAASIVHRDIKPGNVMLTREGTVKVLDFGIARALDSAALTQTVSVVGTAAYMAPEQALGHAADERSDIYSLGCLLYAMLTGGPPFSGEVAAAVVHQQVHSDPRPPSEIVAGLPPSLDTLVGVLLAKSPAARLQRASEVRERLLTVLEAPASTVALPPPTAATRVVGSVVSPPRRGGRRAAPVADPPRRGGGHGAPVTGPPRRRGGHGAAVVIVLALILAIAAAIALSTGGGSSKPSRGGSAGSAGSSQREVPPSVSTAPPRATSSSTAPQSTTPSSSTTAPSTATTTPPATTGPASAPTTTTPGAPGAHNPPPAAAHKPPGHGGTPPGQAKKGPAGKPNGG